MTMFDRRTHLATDVIREVRRHFAEKVYDTVIPRNVRLSEAPSFGRPIIQFDPFSTGAKAYRLFAIEFLARRGIDRANPRLSTDRARKIPVFLIRGMPGSGDPPTAESPDAAGGEE
jgi:hypothetical protein